MDEPWLDSLSEDWNSQPRSSSPSVGRASIATSNTSRLISSTSQHSKIPHLAHHIRNASHGSSFLKPRSSRGIARMNENAALTERTAASLNAVPQSPAEGARRKPSSTFPRKPSSVLSESQNSVQRHTIARGPASQDTPEWKRRLRDGENPESDGFDLFSPSKLEGIFKQSSCPLEPENDENDDSVVVTEKKPWNSLGENSFPLPSYPVSSLRMSRTKIPDMETLQEVEENENENEADFDISAISSDIPRRGEINGMVRRRVSNLEARNAAASRLASFRRSHDPRMRTVSGQKEISDEIFSPVEDSERSSIRRQALQTSLDTDTDELRRKLQDARRQSLRRSNSRSSDPGRYDAPEFDDRDGSVLLEEPAAELTSLSLPEDLSMGTQNYAGNSILSNSRVLNAMDSSVSKMRRPTATSNPPHKTFRSSPPPYRSQSLSQHNIRVSEPSSPDETSVVHHAQSSNQHSTPGSPLKLFGARDTYTNNKLMRVLSQYEDENSELSLPDEAAALRMSNFGQGELDRFGFDKHVERPPAEPLAPDEKEERVFKDLASLNLTEDRVSPIAFPSKERSPKRRRTLLQDELHADGIEIEVKVSQMPDNNLAGKKRRDALPGKEAEDASPQTLASRSILRPSGSRKSSGNGHSRAASASEALQNATQSGPKLTDQLAAELESFAASAVDKKQDSRKASLATKDYMEEANKVMELIRARGKPKSSLPEIPEPGDVSELNPDAIIDLDLDDSTKDSFSRPPSREGRVIPRQHPRHARHDSETANHLKKFHEPEDLELLASTSAIGTWPLANNDAVAEAAQVPVPDDDSPAFDESMQSDPPGMRILNENDRKRKHSQSDIDGLNLGSEGSRRTVATNSSHSSGQRGMITQGTVSIPDTVGVMTFDHENRIWIKQHLKLSKQVAPGVSPSSKLGRQDHSEADPFEGIPDLSIDEMKEASWKKSPLYKAKREIAQALTSAPGQVRELYQEAPKPSPPRKIQPSSIRSPKRQQNTKAESVTHALKSEAAQHEARLHDGHPSTKLDNESTKQPRVVTIAFSSPIASEIPYVGPLTSSDADLDEDDPSLLPLDDDGSVLSTSPAKAFEPLTIADEDIPEDDKARSRTIMGSLERHEAYRAMTLNRRPVSRIDERSEDLEHDHQQPGDNQELSLIHVSHDHHQLTPLPSKQLAVRKTSAPKESSILCLTPLSEFTLHQVDKANHPEESFVGERANPKALRQAHGSAALVEDALVKAITDTEPTELFWEELQRLSLSKAGLAALHGLDEYCSALEYLDVSDNKVAQLSGVPPSIRSLHISSNLLNDLTSWTHLRNLQIVDVSGNRLESVECFSSLVHMRHLNASNNKIRNIEGIFDLDGLITLDLSGNDIPDVDFYSCQLSALEKLDLSKNNLMHLKNIEVLPKLTYLDASDNLLEDLIVDERKVMPDLKTLCLESNELGVLDLTAFPSLQRLSVDSNKLTSLPGLSEAEALTILSARDQQVTSNLINDILTTEHDCAEIYLSSNAVPESGLIVPEQPNYTLRCLELASCGIQCLPQGFGDSFPNLRVANLNFNALSDLSSMQGMIKLRHLYLAKNRIKRMRRTCLTLSRLPALHRVDLRDNPLTVGFYAPENEQSSADKPYRLSERKAEADKKWISLMDEMTWLRRRAMELLLADCCKNAEEVDGLAFDRAFLLKEQATWQRLMGKGVLVKDEKEGSEPTVTVNEVGMGDRQT